jgi:hypothetical protein
MYGPQKGLSNDTSCVLGPISFSFSKLSKMHAQKISATAFLQTIVHTHTSQRMIFY